MLGETSPWVFITTQRDDTDQSGEAMEPKLKPAESHPIVEARDQFVSPIVPVTCHRIFIQRRLEPRVGDTP